MDKAMNKFYVGLLLLMLILLSACNSGDSNTLQSGGDGTGSVAILLTDAPIDDFDQFMLTVTEISLLGDEGAVTLFSGDETLDLLNLQSHADLFSLSNDIPAGNYYKIRMQVSNPQLIRLDMNGEVQKIVVPQMGGNGKLDLNPRSDIMVVEGEMLALQVDLDVEKSIHLIQNGNDQYRFRPVVFVDILTYGVGGKLVRISGYVDDMESGGFELCSVLNNESYTRLDEDAEANEHCVYVYTDEQTVYFDDMGNVLDMPSIQEDDTVTILGYYRNREDRHVGLDAEIVEMAAGDVYKSFYGVVDSLDIENKQFVIRDKQEQLTTILFYSESKFFTMMGESMTLNDLAVGVRVKVEGVYDDAMSMVKAAAIFTESPSEMVESLSGGVLQLHDDLAGFDMSDNLLGDVCVELDGNTNIYLLSIEDGSFNSEEVGLSELQAGQHLEVYGSFRMGCFIAENVLLESL